MIITLRVECVWGPNLQEECVRTIEIDQGASLLDVHYAIQRAVAFDDDHMFEFFAGTGPRRRKMSFAEDEYGDYDADMMGEVILEQVFPLPKSMKLYYHFDFGDDWIFEIRRSRKKPAPPEPGVEYPRVVERIGPDPPQYGQWDEQ